MEIRTNEDNEELWCCYCKDPIELGQKFITITEEDSSGEYEKHYHCNDECAPEDEEDIYIPNQDEVDDNSDESENEDE